MNNNLRNDLAAQANQAAQLAQANVAANQQAHLGAVQPEPAKKPERKIPDSLATLQSPKSIPVKVIEFIRPTNVPGHGGADYVRCDETLQTRKRYTAVLIPHLRSFEIMCHPANQNEPVTVGLVHETHVKNWTPL